MKRVVPFVAGVSWEGADMVLGGLGTDIEEGMNNGAPRNMKAS